MEPRRRIVRAPRWRTRPFYSGVYEPAYECGPDAQTHNELSPQHHREHA